VGALVQALRRVLSTPQMAEEMGRRALEKINSWSFEEDVLALRQAIAQLTRKLIV